MESTLSYTLGTPLYEKARGAETNNKIVWVNIGLGASATVLWLAVGGVTLNPGTPQFIRVTIIATAALLFDRTLWLLCFHLHKQWTATDSAEAHSFERIALFLTFFIYLISETIQNQQCGTNEHGAEEACDVILDSIAPTLIYGLCTVPILHILGTGWKTLKAISNQSKKETIWLPFSGIGTLLYWKGLTLIRIIVSIIVLLATAVVYCLLWLGKLLRR